MDPEIESLPQFIPEAITNVLPQSTDGVPLWVMIGFVLIYLVQPYFKTWLSRAKPETREVRPEPPPVGPADQFALDTRDTVHEVRHMVANLAQRFDAIERSITENRRRS